MGYGGKGGRRGAGRADYTETVSSHLQQQLHMEKTQLHSVVDKLRQETEKVLGEWILLQHYLGQLKVIFEEEEKHIRDFQTHGQQEKQRLEDHLQSQEKERKLVNQKKRFAEKLQHYLTVSLMRSEKLQHELEQVSGQEESLMKTEMLQQGH